MANQPQAKDILGALNNTLAQLKERNANPLALSPLFPYRDVIAALVQEGASASLIANTINTAGLETSPTAVNRFIAASKIRKGKRRKGRGAPGDGEGAA